MIDVRKLWSVWEKGTAHPSYPWTPENPAAGHCLVTASLVQDIMGGELVKCKVGKVTHYYNQIDNKTLDLTKSQFKGPVTYSESVVIPRGQVLKNLFTKQRYELLKERYYGKES